MTSADHNGPTSPIFDNPKDVERAVKELVDALGTGKVDSIEHALSALGVERDSNLYERVGTLARTLHESLREFHSSLAKESVTMHSTNMPDAADKLEAVIKMTFDSAEKTLAAVEHQANEIQQGRAELTELIKLSAATTTSPETRAALQPLIESMTARYRTFDKLNCEVLMAQEFQDLSGQALRKVIKLVQGLERNLIELLRLFGEPERPADVAATPTPGESAGSLEQGDVDSILKGLGF